MYGACNDAARCSDRMAWFWVMDNEIESIWMVSWSDPPQNTIQAFLFRDRHQPWNDRRSRAELLTRDLPSNTSANLSTPTNVLCRPVSGCVRTKQDCQQAKYTTRLHGEVLTEYCVQPLGKQQLPWPQKKDNFMTHFGKIGHEFWRSLELTENRVQSWTNKRVSQLWSANSRAFRSRAVCPPLPVKWCGANGSGIDWQTALSFCRTMTSGLTLHWRSSMCAHERGRHGSGSRREMWSRHGNGASRVARRVG